MKPTRATGPPEPIAPSLRKGATRGHSPARVFVATVPAAISRTGAPSSTPLLRPDLTPQPHGRRASTSSKHVCESAFVHSPTLPAAKVSSTASTSTCPL